jgi:predicted amidohydrolase YtcJ
MEDKLGSLEVGKYADLVVLEQNLFDVSSDELADVKVVATVMDGEFTHRDGI